MTAISGVITNFFKGASLSLEPTTQNILLWIAVVIIVVALYKFFGLKKTISFSLVMALLLFGLIKAEKFLVEMLKKEGETFDPTVIRLVFAAVAAIVFCYYCFIKE